MVNTTDSRNCGKTVSLYRGARGYGFNLAEEFPCYLSAVHEGGVAWKAGLRQGDQLIAVGSVDVAWMPHKEIVKMIANAGEVLRLTAQDNAVGNRGQGTSGSSSSDCDSDHEIWRKQKSELAQKLQRECPKRSRYKNLITPISEALLEDGAASTGSLLRKRGRRYISATGQAGFDCADENAHCHKRTFVSSIQGDHAADKWLIDDQKRCDPFEQTQSRRTKNRPLSVLQPDDLLSFDAAKRQSRNLGKLGKKGTNVSGGRKWTTARSSSAPAYKRTLEPKEASTIACVGLIDDELSSSDDDAKCWKTENRSSENDDEDDEEDLLKKSVVVYIGAVPVPNAGASRKNILKCALQSLRAQRVRAHTVLLEIFTNHIVVTNSRGVMTNRFRADRIAYATACAENKQYFGLTTVMNSRTRHEGSSRLTTTTDETDESRMAIVSDTESSSGAMVCHVFAVDPQLHLHSFHYHYARKFGIHCVRDPETNFCQEFPYSSNSILHAIGYIYRNHRPSTVLGRYSEARTAKIRQTCNGATYVSSNSDSGIGNGKEDFSPSLAFRSTCCPTTSTNWKPDLPISNTQEAERTNAGAKKTKAVRFAEDQRTMEKFDQVASMASDKVDERNQDLLDTASSGPVSPASLAQKEAVDKSGVRHSPQSTHFVSSSATDVRQLLNRQSHFAPLSATKSIAVGHQLPAGSGATGSAGEIRCSSPKSNLGGSNDQLDSSRQLVTGKLTQQSAVSRDTCAGSASSLLSPSELAARQQQHVSLEPNPKSAVSTVASSTKHGSLLRDRINRRLHRNAGGEQNIAGGCGVRSASIKMKQVHKDRLEAWSSDFDRLLRDPAGLYAFSEFLRSQYCQENVNFWIACENYKLADESMRSHFAHELYRSYFATGCMEPVNVDSLARQMIEEAVESENFTLTTFNPAQYQIFHLMKYDCYPRFLKSDEYQRCWELCEKSQQLPEMKEPFLSNVDLTSGSSLSLTSKASCGVGEEHKKSSASSRKSILPWKNKFAGGVNIIGRHKGKKEEDALTAGAQQPSTSTFLVGAHAPLQEGASGTADSALSSVGSKRKQAWRHSKQLSTPAEVTHAIQKPSGSLEGLHPLYTKPNSALVLTRPPDVVPQPDPPSSPSPSPHRRNAASKSVPPGSPLVPRTTPRRNEDSGKFSCTLILPSREKIQASVSEDLTVRRWLHELALQHGLNAAATDIIDMDTNEPVDLSLNASRALADKTVRLEGGVLFKVDLPCSGTPVVGHGSEASQRKLIAVKARADSGAGQVLRPILNKYGLLLDSMVVCIAGTNEVLPNHSPISLANNKKLMVLTQNEFEEWVHRDHDGASLFGSRSSPSRSSLSPSFEDIIGAKYFQELPSHKGLGIAELPPEPEGGKGARHHQQQQLASSNGGHKHVGGMLKFVKRGAAEATSAAATKILGQQTKSLRLPSHTLQQHLATIAGPSAQQTGAAGKKSVLSKQELLDLAREEKRLAELLGRAQASSFDDQRGSCVKNFELPDFLKQPSSLAVPSDSIAAGSSAVPGAQSSSMDDSLIPSGAPSQRLACSSRPTDLVHRKLCGTSGPSAVDKGASPAASGSCEDDFLAASHQTDKRNQVEEKSKEDSFKCVVRINGEKSTAELNELRIPTHEEAEELFGAAGNNEESVDFNDPLMTERRGLSDFGLGVAGVEQIDDSVKSGLLDQSVNVKHSSVGSSQRTPPPPYQQRNYCLPTAAVKNTLGQESGSKDDSTIVSTCRKGREADKGASVGDLAGLLDQEKKRKGLYLNEQDDDWQVDYV